MNHKPAAALAFLALIGTELYDLATSLIEALLASFEASDEVESAIGRILLAAVVFGLGRLGVERYTTDLGDPVDEDGNTLAPVYPDEDLPDDVYQPDIALAPNDGLPEGEPKVPPTEL